MKIAIMQPYFFPYLGYWSLLKHTDQFILFDTVQFIRHGWIERNKILKPDQGCQYIQVPLQKFSRDTRIQNVKINNNIDWQNKILAQLQHYKKAPFYLKTIDLIQSVFGEKYDDIVTLNKTALKTVCDYLGIVKVITVFSKMDISVEPVNAPDEWALNICKAIGNINEYWNPPGGKNFFDKTKYDKANIALKFHSVNLTEYKQKGATFEPRLSIVDVLMFNSPEKINCMLDDYELN